MQLNASYTSAPYLTSYQTLLVVKPLAITVWNQDETAQIRYDFFSPKNICPQYEIDMKGEVVDYRVSQKRTFIFHCHVCKGIK